MDRPLTSNDHLGGAEAVAEAGVRAEEEEEGGGEGTRSENSLDHTA